MGWFDDNHWAGSAYNFGSGYMCQGRTTRRRPRTTNKKGQKCVGFYPTKIYSEEESRNITSPSVKQPLQWDINVVWLAQNAHWGVSQLNRSETDWVETENLTKKVTTSLIRQERPLSESRRSMIKRSNFLKDAA